MTSTTRMHTVTQQACRLSLLASLSGWVACDEAGDPRNASPTRTQAAEQSGAQKPEPSSADAADPGTAADLADGAPTGDDRFAGYDPRVARAARLAFAIDANPQEAEAQLAAAKLDRDQLDALMYEIANDPDLTAQYRIARGL